MNMKRVMTLYRVSTTKQVDVVKDDIPMQKIACRNFIEEKKWQLVGEKEEKGVSGFKVSAAKRDAIQELKEAAERKEFDILYLQLPRNIYHRALEAYQSRSSSLLAQSAYTRICHHP